MLYNALILPHLNYCVTAWGCQCNRIIKLQKKAIRTVMISSYNAQFVSIDGIHSRLSHVSCGVPQGSVLGSKLFILYVNDICNVSNLVKCILFADDTSLFCSVQMQT